MKYRYEFYVNVTQLDNGSGGPGPYKTRLPYFDPYTDTDTMVLCWAGEVEADSIEHATNLCWELLNRDDRPTGNICPSMSIGDVLVFETPDGPVGMACEWSGWRQVKPPTNIDPRSWKQAANY